MRCEELMKRDVRWASPQDTVVEAARRMLDQDVGFLPVCDDHGRVLGAVTDRDLALRVLANDRPATTSIDEVMTRDVVACEPSDPLERAEEIMRRAQVSRIMCIEATGRVDGVISGRLAGVISLSDIAQVGDQAGAVKTLRAVSAREVRESGAAPPV